MHAWPKASGVSSGSRGVPWPSRPKTKRATSPGPRRRGHVAEATFPGGHFSKPRLRGRRRGRHRHLLRVLGAPSPPWQQSARASQPQHRLDPGGGGVRRRRADHVAPPRRSGTARPHTNARYARASPNLDGQRAAKNTRGRPESCCCSTSHDGPWGAGGCAAITAAHHVTGMASRIARPPDSHPGTGPVDRGQLCDDGDGRWRRRI